MTETPLEVVPGAQGRTVRAGGTDTFVQEAGMGPATIFVHGNPDNGNLWRPFLERHTEIGRVIAPDMPGFGRSAHPGGSWGAAREDHARWFTGLLDALEVDRFRLVIHDWGVASVFGALRIPDRCDGLVIIDTVPFTTQWRWHMLAQVWRRKPAGELLTRVNWSGPNIKLVGKISSRAPYPHDDWTREVLHHYGEPFRRGVRNIYRCGTLDELERIAEGDFRVLQCPSLVYWSDGDRFLPTKYAEIWAQQLPNARLEIATGAGGHWFFREEEERCDPVVAFLAGLNTPAPDAAQVA